MTGLLTGGFNKKSGVGYNLQQVEARVYDYSSKQGMNAMFTQSSTPVFNSATTSTNFPGMKTEPEPNDRLDVTHFTSQNFRVAQPNAVPDFDPNKPAIEKPKDPTAQREANAAVKADYQQADLEIKDQILEAIDNVDPDVGASVRAAMPSSGGSSAMQVVSAVADQATGMKTAGDMYAVINAIYSQNKNNKGNIAGDHAKQVLEQAFTGLQKAHQAEVAKYKSGASSAPPKYDMSAMKTPEQMLGYLTRNVEGDTVLKNIAAADLQYDKMEVNYRNYRDIYVQGKQKITPEMVAVATPEEMNNWFKGADNAEAVKTMLTIGPVRSTLDMDPGYAKMMVTALQDNRMPLDTVGALGRDNKKMTDLLDMEPDVSRLVPKLDSKVDFAPRA